MKNIDPRISQKLVQLLDDRDHDIRSAAVLAIHHLGIQDPAVCEILMSRLVEASPRIRRQARKAAEFLGIQEQIRRKVAGQLGDPDDDLRWRAVIVICELPLRDSDLLARVVHLLEDEDPNVRWAAIHTINRHGICEPEVLRRVAELMWDEDPYVRIEAAWLIEGLGIPSSRSHEEADEQRPYFSEPMLQALRQVYGPKGFGDRVEPAGAGEPQADAPAEPPVINHGVRRRGDPDRAIDEPAVGQRGPDPPVLDRPVEQLSDANPAGSRSHRFGD